MIILSFLITTERHFYDPWLFFDSWLKTTAYYLVIFIDRTSFTVFSLILSMTGKINFQTGKAVLSLV